MKTYILAVATLLFLQTSFGQNPTPHNPRMDCRPSTLEIGSTLTLHLPSTHGGELAVQTPSLVFLYIAFEQEQGVYSKNPPIPSAKFKTMQSVTLSGSSVGLDLGSGKPPIPIFSEIGVYHFMVGRNLETEDEMHRNLLCDVRVIAAKPK
jgi:hypothetical protein